MIGIASIDHISFPQESKKSRMTSKPTKKAAEEATCDLAIGTLILLAATLGLVSPGFAAQSESIDELYKKALKRRRRA